MSRVTVLVLNWNGRHVLPACLAALRGQTYGDFSVWVVDNGSTDGSGLWAVENHPEVRVIFHGENRGFCQGYNDVLHQVTSPYVALLNNDVAACPCWLEALVEVMDGDARLWAAASKMVFWDRPEVIDRAGDGYGLEGAAFLRGRGEPASRYDRKERVFGACAGAALYRSAIFRHLGFFDEDFFFLHEDVDVSFRARLQGYECVYVPEALVFHRGSFSLGQESEASVYYGHRNVEWVYLKNMPTPLLCISWPLHVFYMLAAGAYFFVRGRGRSFLKAKRDAFSDVRRLLAKRAAVQKHRVVSSAAVARSLSLNGLARRFRSKGFSL